MGGHPARDYWEGPGLALLIGIFLLAPFAWLLEMQAIQEEPADEQPSPLSPLVR